MDIDIKLLELCLSNNRKAQERLYQVLLPYFNVICKRYLYNNDYYRQDVLQECFIKLFSYLKQYDIQKASFKTWATRIAINCCLDHNIRQHKIPVQELILPLHEQTIKPQVLKKLSNDDLLTWVKTMPKLYYIVFNLYVVDDFSHKEIAEILGIEEAVSRQRLSRARKWLKKRLPDEDWGLITTLKTKRSPSSKYYN